MSCAFGQQSRLTKQRLTAAAREFGTPLFVYDLAGVGDQYQRLSAALPERVAVHYALAANGSLAICARLAELGCGADVCSLGELEIATAAQFGIGRTLFVGPGKTDRELGEAVARGVRWIVIESWQEARRLNTITSLSGRRQGVLARIAPRGLTPGAGLMLADHRQKFGIDEERAAAELAEIAALPSLRLEGIHLYAETGVVEVERLLGIHRRALEVALELDAAGLPISVVGLGGGLGIDSGQGEHFDLRRYSEGLRELMALAPPRWRFLIELGQYLTAELGAYVVSVVDTKVCGGRRHVIVDGGIHQLYRPSMSRANRLVEALGDGGPRQRVTIGGPLPSADDVLVEDVDLPEVGGGDLLAFPCCGAYAFSHSLMGFSCHPTAAEVALEQDDMWLMRRRGRPAEVLRGQYASRGRVAVSGTSLGNWR